MSIICSSINEGIATVLALRAHTLEAGIRDLLGGDDALAASVLRRRASKGPDAEEVVARLARE